MICFEFEFYFFEFVWNLVVGAWNLLTLPVITYTYNYA